MGDKKRQVRILLAMDRFEATRKIRDADSTGINNIPIIAMTAQAMKGDKEKCIHAGMNDYISWPINPQAMFKPIEKYINIIYE